MFAFVENIQELWRYRALILSLIGRELQVRYRGSVFGFLWTFLNPVLQMLVYTLVFKVYLRNGMPNYTYFLFVGLLPWNWMATSILTGTPSISDRRDLITKVRFPPQVLPFTVIGSGLANYAMTVPLMLLLGLLTGSYPGLSIVAFPLVLLVQFVLILGVVYILSSINVTFRDLQHITGNIVMFAFFLTPVLYSADQIPQKYRAIVLLYNPAASIIVAYQSIFFYGVWPDFLALAQAGVLGFFLLVAGSAIMNARRESFAEFA